MNKRKLHRNNLTVNTLLAQDAETNETCHMDLWLKKQRNGERNYKVPLVFLKGITRFESAAKINDKDVPEPPRTTGNFLQDD